MRARCFFPSSRFFLLALGILVAWRTGGGVAALGFARVLDMQLAAEHAAGCAPHADVGAMLRTLGVAADSEGTGAAALLLAWPALRERLGPDIGPLECASLVRATRAVPC